MPRAKRPWFRFYVEAMRDPKMRRLSASQRWLWVAILAAARESCIAGYLMISERTPFSWEDLADYAGMKVKEVEAGTDLMHDLEMIEFDDELGAWFVPKFSERQFESDDVTLRTSKYRSKERVRNVPTSTIGTGNSVHRQSTEIESETEGTVKRRSRTPEHFEITANLKEWANSHACGHIDLDLETQKFLDHHRSKGTLFLDWPAAWRKWVRQSAQWNPAPTRSSGIAPLKMSDAERLAIK